MIFLVILVLFVLSWYYNEAFVYYLMKIWNVVLQCVDSDGNNRLRELAKSAQSENESFGRIPSLCPARLLNPSIRQLDQELKLHHEDIRQELRTLCVDKKYNGIAFGELDEQQKRDFGELTTWRTIWMMFGGKMTAENRWKQQLPTLYRIIEKHQSSMGLAMISILLPQTHIPVHRGPMASFLRFHWSIALPTDSNEFGLRIDGQVMQWQENKSFVFDDTLLHEAWNHSPSQARVVLFADVYRPLPRVLDWMNRFIYKLVQNSRHFKSIQRRLDREGVSFN